MCVCGTSLAWQWQWKPISPHQWRIGSTASVLAGLWWIWQARNAKSWVTKILFIHQAEFMQKVIIYTIYPESKVVVETKVLHKQQDLISHRIICIDCLYVPQSMPYAGISENTGKKGVRTSFTVWGWYFQGYAATAKTSSKAHTNFQLTAHNITP